MGKRLDFKKMASLSSFNDVSDINMLRSDADGDLSFAQLALEDGHISQHSTTQTQTPTISTDNSSNCILFTALLPEIRLIIYELCLQPHTYTFAAKHTGTPAYNTNRKRATETSLLRVCSQMYEEARPLFAQSVTVDIAHGYLARFLRLRSGLVSRARVRHVVVNWERLDTKGLGRLLRELPRLKTLRLNRGTYFVRVPISYEVTFKTLPFELWAKRPVFRALLAESELPWLDVWTMLQIMKARVGRPEFEVVGDVRFFQGRRPETRGDGEQVDGGVLTYRPKQGEFLWKIPVWTLRTEVEVTERWYGAQAKHTEIRWVRDPPVSVRGRGGQR